MAKPNSFDNEDAKSLVKAFLSCQSAGELERFMRDILTESEIAEFGKRWKAAQMLAQRAPYSTIVAETGLSSTTVARVSKWLFEGMGGYQLALKRLGIIPAPTHGNHHHRHHA